VHIVAPCPAATISSCSNLPGSALWLLALRLFLGLLLRYDLKGGGGGAGGGRTRAAPTHRPPYRRTALSEYAAGCSI
jgi:hypothetical protein